MTYKVGSICDSNELVLLRTLIKQSDHRFANKYLTPFRLGIYAGETGARVTDMGGHSRRWRSHFAEGLAYGRKFRQRSKIFNP